MYVDASTYNLYTTILQYKYRFGSRKGSCRAYKCTSVAVRSSGVGTLKCGYNIEEMITLIRQADLLKSDAALHKSVELIGRTIGFKPEWLAQSAFVPSAATIGRYRFKLDMALCLSIRHVFASIASTLFIDLLADPSPRAGREWLFSEPFIISRKGANAFRCARKPATSLCGRPSGCEEERPAGRAPVHCRISHPGTLVGLAR